MNDLKISQNACKASLVKEPRVSRLSAYVVMAPINTRDSGLSTLDFTHLAEAQLHDSTSTSSSLMLIRIVEHNALPSLPLA